MIHKAHQLLAQGLAEPTTVAIDSTLIPARGPCRHKGRKRPSGDDPDAGWGKSDHHDWVYGYAVNVVVTATPGSLVLPLMASVHPANAFEGHALQAQAPRLPPGTRYVLADRIYDTNACSDAVEYGPDGQRLARRFVCPLMGRAGKPTVGRHPHRGQRERHRRDRQRRQSFMRSPLGKHLYRRRSQTVEPFMEWWKAKFDLHDHVPHRGLPNNRTHLLAAMLGYLLLVECHCLRGHKNAQVQYILDEW